MYCIGSKPLGLEPGISSKEGKRLKISEQGGALTQFSRVGFGIVEERREGKKCSWGMKLDFKEEILLLCWEAMSMHRLLKEFMRQAT